MLKTKRPSYFSPFEDVGVIGAAAYQLKLLDMDHVHPVLHAFKVKAVVGSHIVTSFDTYCYEETFFEPKTVPHAHQVWWGDDHEASDD